MCSSLAPLRTIMLLPDDVGVGGEPVAKKCREARGLMREQTREEGRQRDLVTGPGDRGRPCGRPCLEVERITDRAVLEDFLAHVAKQWKALGRVEPYWSVLTRDRFRLSQIASNMAQFEESGRHEASALFALLKRHGTEEVKEGDCIEYGCGVGRVTRWLSAEFKHVAAFDISQGHLTLARRYVREAGCRNVSFHRIRNLADIENLPVASFFYTAIVLQHNPPPVIEVILRGLAGSLRPGGYGFFQVPTYRDGYRFRVKGYIQHLAFPMLRPYMEMHVLPPDRVFSVLRECGCVVVKAVRDNFVGPRYDSYSFLIHKPPE